MKLVDRVSAFFLALLAVVLLLFSVVLYGLAHHYLYERFDRQLEGSLHTLVAAIEVEPDDVKWEPSDHTVTLGTENGIEDVRWVVVDEMGKIVDRSRNLGTSADDSQIIEYAKADRSSGDAAGPPSQWRVLQHRLYAVAPKPIAERDSLERSELVVAAALSTKELKAALFRLLLALGLLSPAIWLIAAVCGRWICRKALAPLEMMARESRALGPAAPDRRLSVSPSGDELAELAEAFNGLLDQLFTALDRQKRFAGDAAHQLRTPLTVLEGQIEVALRKPRSVDEYGTTLAVLRDQVRELNQVIEALLFLARGDEGQAAANRSPIDLGQWLQQFLEKWRSHPRWADIGIDCDSDVEVNTSPALLAQIVENLVTNALKYSPPGSAVDVSVSQDQVTAVIEIRDRGIGIAKEELEAIFRPFYRTTVARQTGQPGTGLGLTIAAQIAKSLEGSLECSSEPGAGTSFRLRLPRVESAQRNLKRLPAITPSAHR
jgi:heavy metal sensor kinase